MKALRFLLSRGLDSVFLVGALVCFGAFGVRAVFVSDRIGLGGSLGEVSAGLVEIKSWGGAQFVPAGPGGPLNNLDVIWIGKGGGAVLRFYDGHRLELGERSLVVLKRPFRFGLKSKQSSKDDKKNKDDELPYRVIQGQAKSVAPAPDASQSPQVASPPRPNPVASQTYGTQPKSGATIFLVDKNRTKILLSWPGAFSGELALQDMQDSRTRQTRKFALKAQTSIEVEVESGHAYQWTVPSSALSPQEPPRTFKVQRLSRQKLDEVIADAALGPNADDALYIY